MTRSSHKAPPRVAFFDSGIGGMPYLREYRRLQPGSKVVYLADTACFPYGDRPTLEVCRRAERIVAHLQAEYAPEVVVIACNTASVVALAHVRDRYPISFVGVVPAVKPAAKLAESGSIVVLSTQNTADDPYTDGLVRQFAAHNRVKRVGLPALVELVERGRCLPDWEDQVVSLLAQSVVPELYSDTSVVVLACTHFLHARHLLRELLPSTIHLVDSVDGVVRRIVDLVGRANDDRLESGPAHDTFDLVTTSPVHDRYSCVEPAARLTTVALG